ncbi:hypothetical protein F5X68DRAFT_270018 [Plectosphaerella plurivora]|uniref:GDP-mannose transporter n=1 Tax=Plectosphaerella plurivora TaxID=936078 RepID=A0A9P8V4R8_9PEZI|nr:hypothetical protein F5X68DRAFT_270018 [Plectosphaerella plurivora]
MDRKRDDDVRDDKAPREDFDFEDNTKEDDGLMGRSARAVGVAESAASLAKITNSAPISIGAYCFSSISMTVVNKYVVSGSNWNLTFLYLAAQAIICVVAIGICNRLGLISNLATIDGPRVKKWMPISIAFVGMIYTSIKALQFLSVPVYTIFKNLTIIAIAYGEVLWFGGKVTPMALSAFALMVLSSVIAAWSDIQSALVGDVGGGAGSTDADAALSALNAGYFWMALNVACSALYVLGMRKVIKQMNFQDWDSMFYNNLLTIPILVLSSLFTEDWSAANFAHNLPADQRTSMLIGIFYSGLAAIFISYCSAWCIRVTSSTTYSMVGALNKLPIAISGLVFFSAPITFGSVSAIFLGFVSGIVYTVSKVKEKEAAKATLPTTEGEARRPA